MTYRVEFPTEIVTVAVSSTVSWGQLVRADASGGPITITLPDATEWFGQAIEIEKIESSVNRVTVVPSGSDNISGLTNYILGSLGDLVSVRSLSANEVIIDGWWGEFYPSLTTITANYTAALRELVSADPTGGTFTVTLPTLTAAMRNKRIAIKNVSTSTNAISVAAAGGNTVDGLATFSASGSRFYVELVAGATDWMVA